MKKYQCHKMVVAAKITGIQITGSDTAMIGYDASAEVMGCHSVSYKWLEKHAPEVGGYLVKYEDGYLSYSPAAAFESGYHEAPGIPTEPMPTPEHDLGA